jgi:hypothetical protein
MGFFFILVEGLLRSLFFFQNDWYTPSSHTHRHNLLSLVPPGAIALPEAIASACRAVAPVGDEVEVGVDSRGSACLDWAVVFEWYRPHYRLLMKSVDNSALLISDWYI